jgi:phosphonate C-P lyase system protein PhnK
MQALQKAAVADGVVWLSVCSSAPSQQGHVDGVGAKRFIADKGAAPTAFLLDPTGVAGKAYGAKTTPHMYIVDKAGQLVYQGGIDDKPTAYSGGMRQRLQIARNLVTSPRLVFMDEPTGGLDVSVQARLLDLIRGLVADLGLAVVLVTHDLAVARLLSHRIIVMKQGHVIETGLTDRVLDDPQAPYTQLLVSSVLAA